MNERIKELLKKAQKITAENYAPGGRDSVREGGIVQIRDPHFYLSLLYKNNT